MYQAADLGSPHDWSINRPIAGTSIHLHGETHVSTRSFQRLGIAGLAALTVVGLLSGCAAKKKTASASTAAASNSSAAAALPSDTPSKVVATGGGKFCQQVADSVNNNVAKEAASGTGVDSIKASVQSFKSLEGSVLKSAPGAIKPDLVTLFGALDQFYSALAAANYDFTKIDPSVEAPLETPAVQAAEQHVDAYMQNTCGIDVGGNAASANPGAAEASASAALASALAKLTASPSS
jgi:hypothetical protein